jgi:uncharacterized protein (TIGR02246 family)
MTGGCDELDTCESDIKQVVVDWSDAFNRHDAHAVATLFTEDGDFTNPQGIHRKGRKEIEERFTTTLGGPIKSAHRTDSVRSIRFLSPEIAAVDVDWEMTGAKAAMAQPSLSAKVFSNRC